MLSLFCIMTALITVVPLICTKFKHDLYYRNGTLLCQFVIYKCLVKLFSIFYIYIYIYTYIYILQDIDKGKYLKTDTYIAHVIVTKDLKNVLLVTDK